jgi:hypothetical protein
MKSTRNARPGAKARLVHQGPEEEAFDEAFWESVGPKARVEALWGMLLDAYAIRGKNAAYEQGLQRSVLRIRKA